MSARINEFRQQRAALIQTAREIADKAYQEKRDMSADENASYQKAMADHKKLTETIKREEELEAAERELDQIPESESRFRGALNSPEKPEKKGNEQEELRAAAFRKFLLSGERFLTEAEHRTLQADNATGGGYLVAPQQWVNKLIQELDKKVFVRERVAAAGNIFQVATAESLGAPALDTDMGDPTWTSELGTGSEDDSIAFGKRELRPHPLARRVVISRTLSRKSIIPIDTLVQSRFVYKFARVQQYNNLRGNGVNGPLGIMVASDGGVPTSQDVATDNTATEIVFNGLKRALYSMPEEYRRGARWAFHDDAVLQLALIKDGDGHYMWTDSVREDETDRLFGKPVDISDQMPNTFSANQYVGALCNWAEGYWIVDSLNMEVQVLRELKAETNQDEYVARYEGDGMPVQKKAFIRVQLGA